MPGEFGLVYPLWNHTRGPENFLDRVVGEVGLDHLTVPVVTGERSQFRLADGFESPYFYTEGGWHYPPQSKLYAASGMRPRTAKWFGTRDVLAEVREYAGKLGLKLILRIDLPRVSALVEHTPQIRCRNAWGDELLGFGPCVSNPDFRELLRATLTDLARYEPAGFEIENLRLAPAPLTREPPLNWQTVLTVRLAHCCFCPACRQIATMAGVDSDAAAQDVRSMLSRLARDSVNRPKAAAVEDGEPHFQAYRACRATQLSTWVTRVAGGAAARRLILVHDAEPAGDLEPLEAVQTQTVMSLVRMDFPWVVPAATSSFDAARRAGCRGLAFPVRGFVGLGADELVRWVSQAAGAGIELSDFESVEEAPREVATWIKQAVRFARRG